VGYNRIDCCIGKYLNFVTTDEAIEDRVNATDTLYEIAIAHGFAHAHGEDRVEAIIAEAFDGADFNPLYGEMAA
jgi:hypothetical protein